MRMIDDPIEQHTIRDIARLRFAGASWREIAVELNHRGQDKKSIVVVADGSPHLNRESTSGRAFVSWLRNRMLLDSLLPFTRDRYPLRHAAARRGKQKTSALRKADPEVAARKIDSDFSILHRGWH